MSSELDIIQKLNSMEFCETCLPQEFSFRLPIMKYILENSPSPKFYQKLIQCCKLFFIMNPVLIINKLEYINQLYHENEWKYCKCELYCCRGQTKIDIEKIKAKLWIIKCLCIGSNPTPTYLPTILFPKIFRHGIEQLDLLDANISFEEVKFLSSGIKECYIRHCIINYSNNDEIVPLENIVQLFSKSKIFLMNFEKKNENGFCKSYDDFFAACDTIEEVALHHPPDTFDIPKFYQHLKMNENRCPIRIYCGNLTPEINEVIVEILNTNEFVCVPLLIQFLGFNVEKYDKMRQIQATEIQKYRS